MEGYPCACKSGFVPNPTGEGCVQEQYTLEMLGKPLSEIMPGAPDTVVVRVTKAANEPKSDVTVRLKVDVEENSGGHDHHDDQRPKGTLSGAACDPPEKHCATAITNSDGLASFSFAAPPVSGTHNFTAACVSHTCSGSPSKIVNVKVPGLEPIPDSPFYRPITPNRDTNHPNTHFLKPEASAKLQAIAKSYYEATYLLRDGWLPNVMLNDASLKWGGVLDCFMTCRNSVPWGASHSEHRKGSVIDIRARVPATNNPNPDTLLYENKFIRAAQDAGADPHLEGSENGRHIHLRLFDIQE
jgi:hypothetical protein